MCAFKFQWGVFVLQWGDFTVFLILMNSVQLKRDTQNVLNVMMVKFPGS